MSIFHDIFDSLFGRKKAEEPTAPQGNAPRTPKTPSAPVPKHPEDPPFPMDEVRTLVLPLEGHDLDRQQLDCIARNAHTHLVLAGAGTGKTTTIVGLVKYLLKSGKYRPGEILALSFTRASAKELSQRIRRETGYDLDAMTFHSLGMQIIAEAEGKKPAIYDKPTKAFVLDTLKEFMKDPGYSRRLAWYLHAKRYWLSRDPNEAESLEEYAQSLRENPPITVRGEQVKSLGEASIANYLYFNGIAYEYERPYEHETADETHGQYFPDFYLPESNTYIEFYGVDRKGQAPPWFEGKDGKTGTQVYLDSMAWKQKLHAAHGTDCIELFYYQEQDDVLTKELGAQLRSRGIDLRPLSPDELWAALGDEKEELDGVASLFATVISLLKSTETLPAQLIDRVTLKTSAFMLTLLTPVYQAYQNMLSSSGMIDFDDMINAARRHVEAGRYRHPYRFVIIDEYQDISQSRHALVNALRRQSDFRLFCVGDDWQSIYRFSGSDVGFIMDFDRWWGACVTSRIETTRRFSQSLIEVSSRFIMRNDRQVRKELRSTQGQGPFAVEEVKGYTDEWAMRFAVERMRELPERATVLLLGRYTFDDRMISAVDAFTVRWDQRRQVKAVSLSGRPDLDIVFRTIHAAKGLEADYVFVLNNRADGLGFPSRIEDDPVVELLLCDSDRFPDAEERRLFYVALTRARKKVFLLTVEGRESCFVRELREAWGERMREAAYTCPRCGGKLLMKSGPYGRFLGCENYRTKGCRFTRNVGGRARDSHDD